MGVKTHSLHHDTPLQFAAHPPHLIRRPAHNPTHVAASQTVAVGAYMVLGGAGTAVYRPATGTVGRSCILPIPSSIAFIADSNATTFTFEVGGIDFHGNQRVVTYQKTTTNRQTCSRVVGDTGVVWWAIDYVKCIANSNLAENVRIGVLYSGFAKASTDLDTRLANDVEASGIYLPIPVTPTYPSVDFAMFPFQLSGLVATALDDGSVGAGGFAYASRIIPVSMSAFAITNPAVNTNFRSVFCFPKATTDPTQGIEIACIVGTPGQTIQR